MLVIDKILKEFDNVYTQFEEAKRTNQFHEASDIKSFLWGLTKAMTIVLDCNVMDYTVTDKEKVDNAIARLNYIENVN